MQHKIWKARQKVPGGFSVLSIFVQSKEQFGHSFAIDVLTVWNELPDDVHSSSSVPSSG